MYRQSLSKRIYVVASSIGKRRSVRGRPSSPTGTMVSYGVSGGDVEKKCSLLGKFISDTDERHIYTAKVGTYIYLFYDMY